MKDFVKWVGEYGFKPLTILLGTGTLVLFCMTLLPSLSWLVKYFTMFIVLPWVLAH